MILPEDIGSCHKLIEEQASLIKQLLVRIEELESRLNKNSSNSNKPPSGDGLKKAPAFNRRKKNKQGGQLGHAGKTLDLVCTPDAVVVLYPDQCSCGARLDAEQTTVVERRQVFDLPKPKLEVTEYQKLEGACVCCGRVVAGAFPQEVPARVQYGNGVRALTTLLNCGFALPIKKIQQLFGDLYGYAINESTIVSNTERCAEHLEVSEQLIKEQLAQSQVGHSDETGIRTAGQLHWLHVFCSTMYTYFFVHTKRGTKALQDSPSVLPHYSGWLVHDCWSSYFKVQGVRHALCGAHILRELQALTEQHILWANWFRRYLLTLLHLVEQHGGVLPEDQQQRTLVLYQNICAEADRIEPPPEKPPGKRGKAKATPARNLLSRLIQHQDAVLAFAFHADVPFTNNLAERDLRPFKTKQKVAGSFRTLHGAQCHARIAGFISTTRKHQLNIFNELKNAFCGYTFLTLKSGC